MSDAKDPHLKVVDRRWWARGGAADAPDATAAPEARKPSYVEDVERRLSDVTAQLQQTLADHRRAQTEFDAARARMRREVTREVERGRRAVVAELLDVLDNLDRALASGRDGLAAAGTAAESSAAVAHLIRGVALVRDQFLGKLERFGVRPMVSLGTPFDASCHEAISLAPVVDPAQDGIVVAVVKEGYVMDDEPLRVASVVVGRSG